jgi:hypothetical protein
VKRGGGFRSGASDLDPAAKIACERWPAAGGEATAAAGDERRRSSPASPQTRVLVHGLGHRVHLREARGLAR